MNSVDSMNPGKNILLCMDLSLSANTLILDSGGGLHGSIWHCTVCQYALESSANHQGIINLHSVLCSKCACTLLNSITIDFEGACSATMWLMSCNYVGVLNQTIATLTDTVPFLSTLQRLYTCFHWMNTVTDAIHFSTALAPWRD